MHSDRTPRLRARSPGGSKVREVSGQHGQPINSNRRRSRSRARGDRAPLAGCRTGTEAGGKFEALSKLVDAYEREYVEIPAPDPIDAFRFRMEQEGVTNEDLIAMFETRQRRSRDQVGTKSGLRQEQLQVLENAEVRRSLPELMIPSGRTNRTKFRDQVLAPLLDARLLEMTIPDKPRSSKQQYRTTAAGLDRLRGDS